MKKYNIIKPGTIARGTWRDDEPTIRILGLDETHDYRKALDNNHVLYKYEFLDERERGRESPNIYRFEFDPYGVLNMKEKELEEAVNLLNL